jgi:hypothetical protein
MSKYNAKELADIKLALITLFVSKGLTHEQAKVDAEIAIVKMLIV